MIRRMDHFTIVTDRLDVTLAFYTALGFVAGARPDFGVPGFWFYIDERPILHVIGVEKMPATRRGTLDHMAYWAEGLIDTADGLRARGVPYRIIRAPRPFSTWQLFFEDPNGAEVEFDFDPAETPPDDWKSHARPPDR